MNFSNFRDEAKTGCQYEKVSNRNNEFLLCSLRDEPMQSEQTDSVRVLSAHTHRKCSKRCQENVTLAKTKHDAIRIVCNWITTQKTKNERAKGEPKI